MNWPRLDEGERAAIVKLMEARIAELHVQLESLSIKGKKSHHHRGRIAELRDLIGQLNPKPSATPIPGRTRDSY